MRTAAARLSLACAVAGQPLGDSWWRISLPARCQAIQTRCPLTP